MDDEEQQLQNEVGDVSDKGRQLSHFIDFSDHDKAIRIYRQMEVLKVSFYQVSYYTYAPYIFKMLLRWISSTGAKYQSIWFGLLCLMPLSTIFQ